MKTEQDNSEPTIPFVSILMPVFNEAGFIDQSLGALLRQTYPQDRMEIIVADGMSKDTTRERIERIASASVIPITIVDNVKQIAPTGLNCAMARANGDIIIRVDGHCEIEPEYVANCVEHLKSGKADGVGGPIETVGDGPQSEAISIAMSSSFGVGGSAFRTVNDREMYTDTVAFPGYTREIIERAGPYNEELVRNQDDEYNYRIRKLGGRILLSPNIRSRYYSRSTFRSLWRQYFQYGYWKVRILQMHPKQMSLRQFAPLIFVLALLFTALLALLTPFGQWPLIALICIYLIANFAASAFSARGKFALIPIVSLSFAILHLSYGFGFLLGVFSFLGHWFKTKPGGVLPVDP